MYIKFYGVRGSIPSPISNQEYSDKIEQIIDICQENKTADKKQIMNLLPYYLKNIYGGNTSCAYIRADDTHFVLDGGSGIKQLGVDLVSELLKNTKRNIHLFFSHTHWDHIQGLPFFAPLFFKDCKLDFYSPHKHIKKIFTTQHLFEFFPVTYTNLSAEINFNRLKINNSVKIDNTEIATFELHHPGKSYSYKFTNNKKSIIYATDSEFNERSIDFLKNSINFFKDADILIFDSQYTAKESFEKLSWGHSSMNTAIDIALKSNVKKLVFFHHEPTYSDQTIYDLYQEACTYKDTVCGTKKLELVVAQEGMKIEL